MFLFVPEEATIFKTTRAPFFLKRSFLMKKFFFWIFVGLFIFGIIGVVESSLMFIPTNVLLALISFSFFSFFLFWYCNLFFENKLKRSQPPFSLQEANARIESINYADFLNYEAAVLIEKILKSNKKNSFNLLYHTLKTPCAQFVFSRLLIDKAELMRAIKSLIEKDLQFSNCFKNTITRSLSVANKRGGEKIRPEDFLVALSYTNDFFEKILMKVDIQKRDLEFLTAWYIRLSKKEKEAKKFWKYENLIKRGSLGREWSAGHIYLLNNFATDWTDVKSKQGFRKIIGHASTIENVERVLSGSDKNSVILVGQPGTGRKSIIDELTRKSFLGLSVPGVNHKRIYKLHLQSLVAQAEGKEETENILDKIFSEVTHAGNIILVIENFHEFISGKETTGTVDISGVLRSYLDYPTFKIVGITNFRDYRRVVEKNQSINSAMGKIEVSQISMDETIRFCEMMTPALENKYNCFISFPAIRTAVELSEKFMASDAFPEKAIQVLEESVIAVTQKKQKILKKKDVATVLSQKVEIPIGEAPDEEKKILLNMEEEVHKIIINQETAVSEIAKSLRRSRADLDTRKGLIGSFLFLGPTGVGKTETAKAIADIYFGSTKRMIRIDMSEFQSISDISRLIGSKDMEGILTGKVIEDPFSLILLDELEKAHKDVLNIFLQILDEGHVTDGFGRKIDFRNCMIIATSNAGYRIIMDSVQKKISLEKIKQDILDYLFRQGVFRPEFVNRFDGVVVFEPLKREHLIKIAHLQLSQLKESLKEKHIEFIITDALKEKIVEISYEPVFGAREMQRVIQNKVGDTFASAMLSDKLKPGDKVKVTADFQLEKIKN